MNTFPYIIFALALWGLYLCYKIYKKKKTPAPMVCPLGANCHDVVTSDFGKFFGIGLEYFGAAYYGIIILGYLVKILIFPEAALMTVFLTLLSLGGFLFSIYLTSVQAFTLKNWCSWCLCSAFISTVIFGLSLIIFMESGIDVGTLAATWKPLFLIMHLFGFALGLGGATVADIFFFRFLKNFKITKRENSTLHVMSNIIWFGIALLVISGIGLYLGNAAVLNETAKFLVKVIIVAIIIINGTILNIIVSPRLVKIAFNKNVHISHGFSVKKSRRLRRLAFAGGGISFSSWYSAFILGTMKDVPFSFGQILMVYITLVACAVLMSQIFERYYSSKTS